jgi:hypothetical protein
MHTLKSSLFVLSFGIQKYYRFNICIILEHQLDLE